MIAYPDRVQQLLDEVRGNDPAQALVTLKAMNTSDSHRALCEGLDALLGTGWYWDIVSYLVQCDALEPTSFMCTALNLELPHANRANSHRMEAMHFLRQQPHHVIVECVSALLFKTSSLSFSYEAVNLLTKGNSETAIYLLVRLMKHHPNDGVRRNAIAGLGRMRDVQVLPYLLNIVENADDDLQMRQEALYVIGRVLAHVYPALEAMQVRLSSVLQNCLYDEDRVLAQSARSALEAWKSSRANTILSEWKSENLRQGTPDVEIFR